MNKDKLISKLIESINKITDNWIFINNNGVTGGEMRRKRGIDIECLVIDIINCISKEYNSDIKAVNGNQDKKKLTINKNGIEINKFHNLDVHVYKNEKLIACIECKTYLDSCYYTRTLNDFMLFRKFNYDIKNYIFSLENSISTNTKEFMDVIYDNVCDNIFFIYDKKRQSSKPLYCESKEININFVSKFVDEIVKLVNY